MCDSRVPVAAAAVTVDILRIEQVWWANAQHWPMLQSQGAKSGGAVDGDTTNSLTQVTLE